MRLGGSVKQKVGYCAVAVADVAIEGLLRMGGSFKQKVGYCAVADVAIEGLLRMGGSFKQKVGYCAAADVATGHLRLRPFQTATPGHNGCLQI